MVRPKVYLPDDRYFDPNPQQKEIAQRLYASVADLPLVCPHGHVDPRLFADEDYSFGTPVDLLIIPDHYVFRMLYSHGIPLESWASPGWMGARSGVITARYGSSSPITSTCFAARPPVCGSRTNCTRSLASRIS